jgi:osmotically-inducible protein OsmY
LGHKPSCERSIGRNYLGSCTISMLAKGDELMARPVGSPRARRSDGDIQREVFSELKWDARLSPADIDVTVKDGIVTLGGKVNSFAQKLAAEDVALRVPGVEGVANEQIVVLSLGSQRSDEDIAAAAGRALVLDAVVPPDKVEVEISNGWVTLSGDVEWNYQKFDAERVVRRLTGVRGITNLIIVSIPLETRPSALWQAAQLIEGWKSLRH